MRLTSSLCAIAIGFAALSAGPVRAEPSILFDARTGQVIESESPFARWYPASLTKLMTTYVAFTMVRSGEITLASPVRISATAAKEPPSKMGYAPGSILTLDNALKILMVKSANDVAMAIGESLAGSAPAFAARMNVEARRLGMIDTNWTNPHGLHDDKQYTTARDLAILAAALRNEFPEYASYFSLPARPRSLTTTR
jgi:D-alanyl-D-alanine carboxypeptidase